MLGALPLVTLTFTSAPLSIHNYTLIIGCPSLAEAARAVRTIPVPGILSTLRPQQEEVAATLSKQSASAAAQLYAAYASSLSSLEHAVPEPLLPASAKDLEGVLRHELADCALVLEADSDETPCSLPTMCDYAPEPMYVREARGKGSTTAFVDVQLGQGCVAFTAGAGASLLELLYRN